ncbi:hypothetical protein WG66_009173 [Moniliophthora roreri]|nr:hypothetical protein WG66_009173 [Moniliophthora roreri]
MGLIPEQHVYLTLKKQCRYREVQTTFLLPTRGHKIFSVYIDGHRAR